MSATVEPAVAVVVVTYRDGGAVLPTLRGVVEQLRESDELVVVDNASGDETARLAADADPRIRVLAQESNTGFAGGANAGAADTRAQLLLFLNPDAVLEPGCLEAMRAVAAAYPNWGAWQALVLMAGGREINTSGGVVHWSGISWAGGCGDPAEAAPTQPQRVGFASGAALMVRRGCWEQAGGFDPEYFMYCEDLDLSLRLRALGYEVGVVPSARVQHEYDFDKGTRKWFLLERNRWLTVLRTYPAPLLALVLPALLALEFVLLAVAAAGGWLPQKLRAQVAVARMLPHVLRGRRALRARRTITAAQFAAGLGSALDSPFLGGPANSRAAVGAQRAYWRGVTALLGAAARLRRPGRRRAPGGLPPP